MSTQWELVTRNRKDKKKQHAKNENTNSTNSKNDHSNGGNSKSEAKQEKVYDENDTKRSRKPQQIKQIEKKKVEKESTKQPKSLEQAVNSIKNADLKDACDTMSLSDVARFLNSKLTIDQYDETYSKLPLNYPLAIVPSHLKWEIERAIIEEAKQTSLHYCIEFCLASIAYNMAKDLPVTGYKLMIQFIAEYNPSHFTKCTAKVQSLMNSFQNRPQIGLTLLWAIGQGGIKNFNVGVKVWKENMVPAFDLKHYYKYTTNYLITLLEIHSSNKKLIIKGTEFMDIFTFIHGNKKTLPKDVEKNILMQSPILRSLYFEKSESWKEFNFMEKLFDQLPDEYYKNGRWDFKTQEALFCIAEALSKDPFNYLKWERIHVKYLKGSTHFLAYLDKEWKRASPKLESSHLAKSISHAASVYRELLKVKRRDEELECALAACQKITERMARSKGFPWTAACFVLAGAVLVALIVLDVTQSGSYKKSQTSKVADVSLEYAKLGSVKALTASAKGYKWAEENVPQFYSGVADFFRPYGKLGRDLWAIAVSHSKQVLDNMKAFSAEKWPIVAAAVDGYLPGFTDAVRRHSTTAWTAVKNFVLYYRDAIYHYLTTKVFIGNWAPEALHAKTMQALNTTQLYAAEYYKWFYKHVDNYSKL